MSVPKRRASETRSDGAAFIGNRDDPAASAIPWRRIVSVALYLGLMFVLGWALALWLLTLLLAEMGVR